MATETSRLDLVKPDYVDTADIAVINGNMDVIDSAMGVSIVNSVAEISEPYNGQFAYELTYHQLHFFINGEWLLVASGDQNVGNPNRIRLPAGSLNDLDDTTNAFQVGEDDAQNIAIDQNEIQSRNDEAAATLYLNEQGGDVHVGPSSEIVITNKGFKSDNMDSQEAFSGNNNNVTSTSWVDGGGDSVSAVCEAPPSGKCLVLLCGRSNIDAGDSVLISYKCTRISNGNDLVSEGGSGNTLTNAKDDSSTNNQNNITSTVADMVKGMVVGENYRFKVMHKKETSGTTAQIDFRKILVIPQV